MILSAVLHSVCCSQPTVFFSHQTNTSHQQYFFSHNKSAAAISHSQPNIVFLDRQPSSKKIYKRYTAPRLLSSQSSHIYMFFVSGSTQQRYQFWNKKKSFLLHVLRERAAFCSCWCTPQGATAQPAHRKQIKHKPKHIKLQCYSCKFIIGDKGNSFYEKCVHIERIRGELDEQQ